MSQTSAPERRWLDVALRGAVGEARRSPELFERARDLGLDATLWARAGALGIERPAGERAMRRLHLVDTLTRRHDIGEVWGALKERGIEALLLKGEPFARVLYGDPFARRSGDIDLMVSWREVADAAGALGALGYRPMAEERPEPWVKHEWAFAHPRTRRVVEIQWALEGPQLRTPSFAALWAKARAIELGPGVAITAPNREGMFAVSVVHFYHHAGTLKGLCDVAACLDVLAPAELARALAALDRLGLGAIAQWPIHVLSAWSGTRAPGWRRSPRAAWYAARTARAFGGVLGLRAPISPAHAAASKSTGATRREVGLWRAWAVGLSPRPIATLWRTIARSPRSLALDRGAARAAPRDWIAWGVRPLELARKAAETRA